MRSVKDGREPARRVTPFFVAPLRPVLVHSSRRWSQGVEGEILLLTERAKREACFEKLNPLGNVFDLGCSGLYGGWFTVDSS